MNNKGVPFISRRHVLSAVEGSSCTLLAAAESVTPAFLQGFPNSQEPRDQWAMSLNHVQSESTQASPPHHSHGNQMTVLRHLPANHSLILLLPACCEPVRSARGFPNLSSTFALSLVFPPSIDASQEDPASVEMLPLRISGWSQNRQSVLHF